MFHLRRWLLPARKLLQMFCNWDFFLFSFPPFRWSGVEEGGSGCTWYCVPWGFLPSRWGGSASGLLSVARERALASLAPSGAGEGRVARSQRSFFMPATLVGCLSPFLAARSTMWGIVGDFGGSLPRLSSRGSRSSDRGARVDKRARSWSGGFR